MGQLKIENAKPIMNQVPAIKTVQDIRDAAKRLGQIWKGDVKLGDAFFLFTDEYGSVTPEEFTTLWRISDGKTIPEVYLLMHYPAMRHIRALPVDDQVRHVCQKQPFKLLMTVTLDGKEVFVSRTYEQLSVGDCEQLFKGDPGREMELTLYDLMREGESSRQVVIRRQTE
jgi:hypothetical protein